MQRSRIIVPGAGCGSFELSALVSEALGDVADFLTRPGPTGWPQGPLGALPSA